MPIWMRCSVGYASRHRCGDVRTDCNRLDNARRTSLPRFRELCEWPVSVQQFSQQASRSPVPECLVLRLILSPPDCRARPTGARATGPSFFIAPSPCRELQGGRTHPRGAEVQGGDRGRHVIGNDEVDSIRIRCLWVDGSRGDLGCPSIDDYFQGAERKLTTLAGCRRQLWTQTARIEGEFFACGRRMSRGHRTAIGSVKDCPASPPDNDFRSKRWKQLHQKPGSVPAIYATVGRILGHRRLHACSRRASHRG